MKTKIIIALVWTAIVPLAFAATKKTTKASPLETPAATPAAEIQTVHAFTPGEAAIEVQSTPQNRPIKYMLSKKVRFIDGRTGKAVDPHKITPGTQVRLESKTKGKHGVYRRVVVVQTQ